MIAVLGSDNAVGRSYAGRGLGRWPMVFLQYPADRRCADVKPCSRQGLGNLDLTHGRAQDLESLDNVTHEIWKAVHWRVDLHQSIRSFFIDASCPRSDRSRRDLENTSCLFQRPPSSCTQFQNGHAFCGRIMWPSEWIDSAHASVFDTDLFTQQGEFLCQTVALCLEPNPSVDAVGGPTTGIRRRELSERNDMQ